MAEPKQVERTDRHLTRTFSTKLSTVEKIEQRAKEEGHGNFSRVVNEAVDAYLGDEDAAEPKAKVA